MLFCSRPKAAVLVVAGFAALFLVRAAFAQETRVPPAHQITARDCSPDLFERVDRYYRGRQFSSEALVVAEKYVRTILDVCPSSSSDEVLKSELQTMEEERSEQSFLVGKFYLNQAQNGENGLKGSQARFLEILERYPNYSKIDEVLLLLCRTYELESDFEYYPRDEEKLQLLIKQFPLSPSRGTIETVIQELKIRETVERIKEGT